MTKGITSYKFGNPELIKTDHVSEYHAALLIAADRLIVFWNGTVRGYFNRSSPNYFSKTGKFHLVAQRKRSTLQNALARPIIIGNYCELLLKPIPLKNTDGSQSDLITILQSGAKGKSGMHYDPTNQRMMPGGTWKGFPASYWVLWDNRFRQQCALEESKLPEYISSIQRNVDRGFADEAGVIRYNNAEDVVTAYHENEIKTVAQVMH